MHTSLTHTHTQVTWQEFQSALNRTAITLTDTQMYTLGADLQRTFGADT